MKKTFTIITVLILFTLVLTACGTSNSPQANATSNNTGSNADTGNGGNNNSFNNAPLPLASELVIGTFKLEGTANAVTAQEAANLLPLWQVYKDLTTSSSAAQQEVDALAQQIQGTMTPEQVKAITDMKLSRQDMFTTMQTLGIASTGGGGPTASGTPRPGGGQGGNDFGGGGFPGGGNGAPGGGQGFNNGQSLSPQQIATFQARSSQNGGNGGNGRANRIPTALYDALIKLLQSKK